MSDSPNTTPVKKDALGYDAFTTYTVNDGLGINALPDSEKYKKGIRENTTGRARTLGIWMSCPDCGFNRKFQGNVLSRIVRARTFLSLWQRKIQCFIP